MDSKEEVVNGKWSVFGRICTRILFCLVCVHLPLATRHSPLLYGAQQPQAQNGQPIYAVNAKYVQGVGPGYWVTTGTWPNVNVAAGTAFCGNPQAPVTYPGGTLPMAASATNYVYLDPAGNCAPASNTTGFAAGQIPLAKVITGSSSITSIADLRTWFVPQPLGTDSTGHVEGTRFCDQFSGSTPCASAIANAGATGAVVVNPASNSASAETICGAGSPYASFSLTDNTNGCSNGPNVQVWDFRNGLHITNYDTPVNSTDNGGLPNVIIGNQWVGNRYRTNGYSQFMNVIENSFSQKVFDGGSNLDYEYSSPFYADKTVFQTVNISGQYYTPAEHIPLTVQAASGATGDNIGIEVQTQNYGGASTPGDEGLESAGFSAKQVSDVYSGSICGPPTCAALSQGATQITVSNSQAGTEQGAGRPLLDISKGSNGALASIGNYSLGGWTWPQYTGSGTSWTANTVLALTDAAIPGPNCASSTTLPTTCTVTPANYIMGTNLNAVMTSTPIVVADDGSFEVVKATSFSGSPSNAFTATFTKPHPAGAVVSVATSGACASGNPGVCAGYFIELVSDRYGGSGYSSACGVSPAVNCVRQAFPILAVTDSTHLVPWAVGNNGIGYNGHGIAGSCSPPTCTAWQQSNQYYTYPGAEVLSWQQGGKLSDTATLAPNGVNWAGGEAVENQHYWQFASSGNVISSVQKFVPFVGGGTSSPMKILLFGHGWQRAENALIIQNFNDSSEYQDYVNGSPLAPPYLLEAQGLFFYGLWMPTAPSVYGGAALRIGCPAIRVNNGSPVNTGTNCSSTQPVVDIINDDAAGFDSLSLNPSSSQFVLTASNGAKAYTFGASALSVPGSVTSAGAISVSAGGTNQNVTLTPSGTGFTVLNGNVGVGTSTPVQKLDVNGAVRSALNTVVFSTTPAFDASLGNAQKITLTGNVTGSTLINASAGEEIDFIVCQDSTGGRTFVWPANLKGGMTIGSTASKCSAQSFVFDGSNAYASSPGVTNL